MRILLLSDEPIRKEFSAGNTFLNLFKDYDDIELANVCTRTGQPDAKISKCFCITEKMIIKGFLKNIPAGIEVGLHQPSISPVKSTSKLKIIAKKYRLTVFFWIQNLIWRLGNWKSKSYADFIKDFNPHIILTFLSNNVYLNKLVLHTNSLIDAKLVLYAWDNNYSLRQFYISPLRWIKLLIDRSSMRKVAKAADLLYVISNVQKDDYTKAFNKECKLLTKSADFTQKPNVKESYNKPLELVYTGNIALNRWKSLSHIANVLEKINASEIKAQLKIYTGTAVTKKMSKALNKGNSSFIMGSVSADKVKEIQENADMLVHVEALDLKNKLTVRQSFSTKIVDYLAAARPILAFGPKDVASVDHFVKNDCAIVADNEQELYNKLLEVIDNKIKLDELSVKAYECGKKHHNKLDVDNMLKADMAQLLK